MAAQIDIFWVLSVAFCAWIGYRLAEHYGLNPIAGLTLGAAINVLVATDFSSLDGGLTASSHEFRLLSLYFSLLLSLSFLLFVGKRKALALLKIGGVVTMIALAFSVVPRDRGQQMGRLPGLAIPPGIVSEPIARAQLPNQLLSGVLQSRLGFETLARANRGSPLFYGVFSTPSQSDAKVSAGVWVLVRRSIRDRRGRDWTEILLPDANGEYREGRSRIGFVPSDILSFRVPVPTLAD